MKNVLMIALLLVSILFSLSGFAQDYVKWEIPEHATLRLGKGSIYDLKHSPNGDLIAVASSIGVWIYDADSGKEIRLLQKQTYEVSSLAFSPNGKLLASCGTHQIDLWEPHTGRLLSTLKESPTARIGALDLIFFLDGKTLVSAGRAIIRFWDVANGAISKTLTGHTREILSLAISPNGKIIVSGSSLGHGENRQSNALRWWDVETGRTMFFSLNVEAVTALSFSSNGKILACANFSLTSNDSPKIHLFDGVNGEILKILPGHKVKITALAFSPDGKMLASSGWDNTIRLWDPHSGRHIHTFRGHTDGVQTLSFSSDSETLVSGSEDGTIRFWDTSTKQQSFSISGHWGGIDALSFSTDSKTLISGSPHATIHKWDIGTGQLTSTLAGRYGEQILAFDMKGRMFASIGSSLEEGWNKTYIRHIDTGESRTRTSIDIGKYPYRAKATFSHDGRTLVSTYLVRGELGKRAKESYQKLLENKDAEVRGELGKRAKVEFWNTLFLRLEFEFVPDENPEVSKLSLNHEEITALASSPDGNLLATAKGGKVSLWKFATDEFIRLYPEFFGCDALAFSNDSKILAIGDSLEIRLIEVDTGNLITTLSKHNDGVTALAFSPNGEMLASGSDDGTILIWALDKIIKSQ